MLGCAEGVVLCVCTVGVVQCASFVDSSPGQLPVAHFCVCVEA